MSAKLTKLFPPSIKPVHVGPYKTSYGPNEGFSYWDGKCWGNQRSAPWHCRAGQTTGAIQRKYWHGLAADPIAAARALYEASLDDSIHCNRYPSWDELKPATRDVWIAKAAR